MLGRARKPLLFGAGLLGVLLVAMVAGVAVALTTTAGARWSLGALAGFAPGELILGRVEGSVAGGLILSDIRYESPEVAAVLARVEIEARLGALLDGRVVLSRLAVANGMVTLREPGSATAEPSGEPPAMPELPEWLVVQSLRLREITVAGVVDAELAALEASVEGPRIALETLQARAAGGRIEASGNLRLGADATARIEGSFATPAEPSEAAAGGNGTRVDLAADLELVTSAMPWRAALAWNRLTVQAAGTQWSSPMGRLTLTPGTVPITAEVTAELTGSALPDAATVSGSARLRADTLELEQLTVETLGGRIVAHGAADVRALAGYAALDYSMLDPSIVDPRVVGSLSGNVVAAFAAETELIAGAAGVLGGTLGGRPLDGTLRARMVSGVAHVDRARIVLEQSVIEVAGRVADDSVDLTFEARLPALEYWYPPAAGAVRATGSLLGPANDPTIDVALDSENVSVEGLPPLDDLALAVTGSLSAHQARLSASSPYGEIGVRVEQGWSGTRLAGTLLESRLETERAGTWTLSDPADYSAAGANVELARLCFAGPEDAQLCVAVADDTLRVDAADIPSALAEPWLGGDLRLAGTADVDLTFGWRPTLHGSFTLTQPTLRLQQARAAGVDDPAPGDLAAIDGLRITGTLTEQAFEASMTAALAATGDPLEAQVSLAPPTAEGMLDATVSARLTSLELVDALVEDVEELTGSLSLSLRATGSLGEPELDGEIAARSLGAFVPALGIEVAEGRFTARPVGLDALELDAALCSMGCVELEGSVAFADETAPWRATAQLRGDSFELVDLPDFRAVIAPALMLEATPAAWRVTGELAIEEGLAAVEAVPRSAVRPVPVTVVHGRTEEAEAEELPVPLIVDVDVSLGDDVRFEGLGLSAQLDGRLNIERTAEGQLLVNGTASIEEGTFSAYSQELVIERGDLLFTGPSDNPALDVRATREVDGATVGLTVTGTLRDPQSEVFSMPVLTESEALARLVTGRSLASAGTADAQAIERAALGLGIRRALPALERIGGNLGLDELGVDSGSGSDEAALVAGTQLGEDVYLRYKHGLFDDFAGLELVYRITERFRLRTETGTSQSIDLLYERNRDEDASLADTESPFENRELEAAPQPP